MIKICFFQDEPSSDPAEQKADEREEVEAPRPEDKQEEMAVEESPAAQVFAKALETSVPADRHFSSRAQYHLCC